MSSLKIACIALLVGGALGFSANHFLLAPNQAAPVESAKSNEPLYWVAPMDPNYKRDKPGKSPMGMDLIPVYEEDQGSNQVQAGTVQINPAVENNLGVKTEQVKKERLSPRIETVGYIAFDESKLWQTNVRASGWVEKLNINAIGEKVNKGEVLFTLYSPELVKAQEELLNAYRTKRNGLIEGARERLITLGVDNAQINAIVRSGKASQTIDIKAPEDGVIASLNIREGGYLSPAQAVISAGTIDEVWVDAEVFERQAQWIKTGSHADMTLDALPGETWQGEVDYIYPILDPETRTLRVRLKFTNSDGDLKPNMFANIALQPVTDETVLTIPKLAVIRSGGMARVVLAEGEGKYRSTRIKVGREAAERIEVLDGLSEKDRIVTSAHFMLDSESSQTADLSRINGTTANVDSAWAKGEITEVMADHRMLTINHQPVPQWDWPGMVMNFTLAQGVEMGDVKTGQSIEFEIQKSPSGQYEIIDFKIDENIVAKEVWTTGSITMLMADFGMITLSHDPVSEWSWEAGEMNFTASDDIDLSPLKEGMQVRFLIEKEGTEYLLKKIETDEGSL